MVCSFSGIWSGSQRPYFVLKCPQTTQQLELPACVSQSRCRQSRFNSLSLLFLFLLWLILASFIVFREVHRLPIKIPDAPWSNTCATNMEYHKHLRKKMHWNGLRNNHELQRSEGSLMLSWTKRLQYVNNWQTFCNGHHCLDHGSDLLHIAGDIGRAKDLLACRLKFDNSFYEVSWANLHSVVVLHDPPLTNMWRHKLRILLHHWYTYMAVPYDLMFICMDYRLQSSFNRCLKRSTAFKSLNFRTSWM